MLMMRIIVSAFFIGLFQNAVAASTGEESAEGSSRVEACSRAKTKASSSADISKRADGRGENRNASVRIQDCDCERKEKPLMPQFAYECTVSWSYKPN